VLGGEVVERQQLGLIVLDLLNRLGVLCVVLLGEYGDGYAGLLLVPGVANVLDGALSRRLGRLRQGIENICSKAGTTARVCRAVPTGEVVYVRVMLRENRWGRTPPVERVVRPPPSAGRP
jgi:hypothetical protein